MATRSARSTRNNQPTQSNAGLIVGLGLIAALVATWFKLPGFAILWIAMLAAAILEPPVQLTGPKKNGYPTPINDEEADKLSRSKVWQRLRLTLIIPVAALPGWPVLGIWIAGVLAFLVGAMLPAEVPPSMVGPSDTALQMVAVYQVWMRIANAVAAFTVITAFQEANRKRLAGHPGVRVNTLVAAIKENPLPMIGRALGGGIAAVAILVAVHFYGGPDVTAWTSTVSPAILGPIFLLAAGGAVWGPWSEKALAKWKLVEEGKAEWAPRWLGIKQDPAPELVDRVVDEENGLIVDTFDAPRNIGAMKAIETAPKLAPSVGAGQTLVLLTHPLAPQGQPQPGTADQVRFRGVIWDSAAFPDLTDPKHSADMVQLAAEFGLAQLTDTQSQPRMLPVAIEPITTEDSPTAAYRSLWEGTHVGTIRIGKLVGAASQKLGCEVLIDHRAADGNGILYFGDLTSGQAVFEDPDMEKNLADIANEDFWVQVWNTGSPSRLSENVPTISVPVYAEANLADGTQVKRQPFVTRKGVSPQEYFGSEPKLAASLGAVPFVSITGWPGQSQRPGERHPQALCVTWSTRPVPSTIDAMGPVEGGTVSQVDQPEKSRNPYSGRDRRPAPRRPRSPRPAMTLATTWVIAGKINKAFDSAKLARPEVVTAYALSTVESRRHLWKIQLRLHDGVTLDEVRAKAEKLRTDMGVPWLRVVDAPDGCIIVAGADPDHVTLVNPTTDAAWLVSLDWEQAFLAAGITGLGGLLPKLTDRNHLEFNETVSVLDFSLPQGLSVDRIKGAIKKLKAATGNDFVDLRQSPRGASSFRLLVSEVNPLPERAGFDFDIAASAPQYIYFSTGVEGEPIAMDTYENYHALLAGTSGSGKSVLAQNFLWGFAAHGDIVCVIDPMKQAADFQFLADYAAGFAVDIFEGAALMKAIYAEVRRRMIFNAAHKVGNYRDLPEEIRPRRLIVFIDEFTSLMGKDVVPPESDDLEEQKERETVIAMNNARQTIGTFTGKLAREARSAGVHLLLGTQKLSASMLDKIPGGNDLKTNLARVLLGNATLGDKQSALRAPLDAPDLGDTIPKGRGLWEPLTSPVPIAIQCWFAPQPELARELAARIDPIADEDKIDFAPFMPKLEDDDEGEFGPPADWDDTTPAVVADPFGTSGTEEEVVEEVELDFGDLDLDAFEIMDETDPTEDESDEGTDPTETDEAGADPDFVMIDEPEPAIPEEDLDWDTEPDDELVQEPEPDEDDQVEPDEPGPDEPDDLLDDEPEPDEDDLDEDDDTTEAELDDQVPDFRLGADPDPEAGATAPEATGDDPEAEDELVQPETAEEPQEAAEEAVEAEDEPEAPAEPAEAPEPAPEAPAAVQAPSPFTVFDDDDDWLTAAPKEPAPKPAEDPFDDDDWGITAPAPASPPVALPDEGVRKIASRRDLDKDDPFAL